MFRRSLSQTKNIPTIEMGDLAVREFDENTMIKTIRGFLNSHLKLNETERKIELQSNIPPDNDFWPLDDIRRSFEKLLHEKDKIKLSLVTLDQIMRRQRAQEKMESDRILKIERDKVSSLEGELVKVRHEKTELEWRLNVENSTVRAIADDVKTLKAGQAKNEAEIASLKEPREGERREAFQTMPMLIANCGSKNMNVDSGVNDGLVRLRALTSRYTGRNVVHSYKSAKPQDIDQWSKDLQHPRKAGMNIWSKITRLRKIYQLHPYDGVSLLCTVLNNTEADKVKRDVDIGLGEDQQNLDHGWKAVREWIQEATNASTDWGKISGCRQKANEAVDEFAQRFAEAFLRHSGMSGMTEENVMTNNNGALKANFLHNTVPELKSIIKLTTPGWEDTTFTFEMLINVARRIERNTEQRVRNVSTHGLHTDPEFMLRNVKVGNQGDPRSIRTRKIETSRNACHKCGKQGHWADKCRLLGKRKHNPHSRYDNESMFCRFIKLNDYQRQALMSAVPGN